MARAEKRASGQPPSNTNRRDPMTILAHPIIRTLGPLALKVGVVIMLKLLERARR